MAGTVKNWNEGGVSSMTEILPIALPQLVLWYDGTRIQTWPVLLAKIDTEVVLPSVTDFGLKYVTDRMTDKRNAAAQKVTRNLPGLERKGNQLILRGLGLLEQTSGGYKLSDIGQKLANTYSCFPQSNDWVRILGRLLLTREPRTRTLIRLLSEEDATLYFTSDEWWGGSLQRAAINFLDGRQITPFAIKDEPLPNLRSAINEQAWWALGEWRTHPLINGAEKCRFVGQLKKDFSLDHISLALRAACEVFIQLGVLRYQGGRCWLDKSVAIREFDSKLVKDFGWQTTTVTKPLYEILMGLLPDLRMDTGFVVASELRNRLYQFGFENPDREIARLETEGRLVIEAADYGQSRHGIGLYEDQSKQLIKLRVC